MAKFDFPMEQILQIKKKLEKQKQLELGKAMQDLMHKQEQLVKLKLHLKNANQRFQETMSSGRLHQLEIKKIHERIQYYHSAVALQKKNVIESEQQVEMAKDALKKALQERKTFESLKEKAFEAYLESEKLDEAKRLDEIVSYKYRNS